MERILLLGINDIFTLSLTLWIVDAVVGNLATCMP